MVCLWVCKLDVGLNVLLEQKSYPQYAPVIHSYSRFIHRLTWFLNCFNRQEGRPFYKTFPLVFAEA